MKFFAVTLIAVLSLFGASCGGSTPNSNPDEVLTAWVKALHDNNFGEACSHLAKSMGGQSRRCSVNYTGNVGFAILQGFDPFAKAEILIDKDGNPAKVVTESGDLVYTLIDCTRQIGATDVVLSKNGEGEWVIVGFGTYAGLYGESGEKAPQCVKEAP